MNNIWKKYFNEWVEQGGRTGEMAYGVQNFMTGKGQLMLEDIAKDKMSKTKDDIEKIIRNHQFMPRDGEPHQVNSMVEELEAHTQEQVDSAVEVALEDFDNLIRDTTTGIVIELADITRVRHTFVASRKDSKQYLKQRKVKEEGLNG